MKPLDMLLGEHRLIEQIVPLINVEVKKAGENKKIPVAFIESAVDFFKTYADRTHEGKEEHILFKALKQKSLLKEHAAQMEALINDHIYARKTVINLMSSNERHGTGDWNASREVIENLRILADFYPKHIAKEDKTFFPLAMGYFSEKELDEMLVGFYEHDRQMIHEKYRKLMDDLK